jgi:tetratricopeptide (TPR) repeat protein
MKITTKLAAAIALAQLAACGGAPKRIASTPPPVAPAANEVDQIDGLLLRGDTDAARKRIRAALKRDPMNAQVQLLRDSLERDPKDLLGPQNYPYTVRADDTISGIAQRVLGNRLKAYQLARYNNLSAPFALTAGQTLRMPGTPPHVEPPRRPAPTPAPVRAAPAPRAAAAKPVVAKAAPASNPAAARQLRTAGLAALNQGNVARAVGLLHRAAAADPGNPLIARDLSRAQRIAATVKARR